MAINKNHEFEEIDGVKCGIVEKNVSPERVAFLKNLLEHNHYSVVVVASPPPKAAVPPKPAPAAEGEQAPPVAAPTPPAAPSTFTVAVTDYTFNPINAIFGRSLKTSSGHIVTQAFWYQQEQSSADETPYYERTPLQ